MPQLEVAIPANGFPRIGADWFDREHAWPPRVDGAEYDSSVAAPDATGFRLYSIAELRALPDPEPLVEGLLYADTFAALTGEKNSFKSFVAIEIALAVSTGALCFGRQVRRGPVLYIHGEGGPGMKHRVDAWERYAGVQLGESDIRFLPEGVLLTEEAQAAKLVRSVIDTMPVLPRLIVVDTLARSFRGNENASEDMGAFVRGCDRLRTECQAAVLVIHHHGWGTEHSRGSTALPAAVDTELVTKRDGDRVTVRCEKQKDAEPFADFELEFCAVSGTRSGVLRTIGPDQRSLSDNQRRLLQLLQTLVQSSGPVSATDWFENSGMAKSSFNHAKGRLISFAYVRNRGRRFEPTESGTAFLRDASRLSTNVAVGGGPIGPIEVQSSQMNLREVESNPAGG